MVALKSAISLDCNSSTDRNGSDAACASPSRGWSAPSALQPQATQLTLRSLNDSGACDAPTLLVGEREHRLYVLRAEKVDYIEAHGNYVKFHLGTVEYISRDTVKHLWVALAGMGFIRINRSLVLNVRAISYAQPVGRREYAFTLHSGSCLRSGSAYRHEIRRLLPLAPRARSSR